MYKVDHIEWIWLCKIHKKCRSTLNYSTKYSILFNAFDWTGYCQWAFFTFIFEFIWIDVCVGKFFMQFGYENFLNYLVGKFFFLSFLAECILHYLKEFGHCNSQIKTISEFESIEFGLKKGLTSKLKKLFDKSRSTLQNGYSIESGDGSHFRAKSYAKSTFTKENYYNSVIYSM